MPWWNVRPNTWQGNRFVMPGLTMPPQNWWQGNQFMTPAMSSPAMPPVPPAPPLAPPPSAVPPIIGPQPANADVGAPISPADIQEPSFHPLPPLAPQTPSANAATGPANYGFASDFGPAPIIPVESAPLPPITALQGDVPSLDHNLFSLEGTTGSAYQPLMPPVMGPSANAATGPANYGTGDFRPTGMPFLDNPINSVVQNPGASAINAGVSLVPVLGQLNTISGFLGGPTVGGLGTALARELTGYDQPAATQPIAPQEVIPLEQSIDPVGDILNSDNPYEQYMDWIGDSYHRGGMVRARRGAPHDMPIMAQAGEYVLNPVMTAKIGKEVLDRINKGKIKVSKLKKAAKK